MLNLSKELSVLQWNRAIKAVILGRAEVTASPSFSPGTISLYLKLRAQTTAFRLICNTVLSGRLGLERSEMGTRGVTQNFCLVFISFRSLQNPCPFEVTGKTATDNGFPQTPPPHLGKHVVFPSKFPSETSLCQNKAQLKTRILCKWLPAGTILRCLFCCVCRMNQWGATHHVVNTFLQQWASLQEAFGTSSEQLLGSRRKSHYWGPWGPVRQLHVQHRA